MEYKEIWMDVIGYEGYYKVSNLGRVKSLDRQVWNGYVNYTKKGRILKCQKNQNGYIKTELQIESKKISYRIHRLVAEAFIPNPQNKYAVNHIDGNKENNFLNNLEWVTKSENMIHAYENGLSEIRGERIQKIALFTDEQILEIRAMHIPYKMTAKMIAKKFDCSYHTIEGILFRRRYTHI